jgi:hypothetical protein
MRWPRGAWASATVAAIAIACSSFDEPPAKPDGGDGDAGSGGDAGGSVADGATAGDANGGSDAVSDAGACMPLPSGCDGGIVQMFDFDVGEVPPIGWDDESEDGSIAQVAMPGPCTPGFFRASATVPGQVGASAHAHISKSFFGSFGSAHVAFAFRGPQPVANGYANIGCLLVLRSSAGSYPRTGVRLTIVSDRLSYGGSIRDPDGGSVDTDAGLVLDQAFTAGTWHTLDARFAITSSAVTVSTIYDGMKLSDFVVDLLEESGRADIECGINYAEEEGASYTQDLDDAFIELCP